jgi:hypothetical protein
LGGGRGFGQRRGLFRHDVLGLLVLAQPDEAAVAHDILGGEFGEGDFGDQFGLEPLRAARLGAGDLHRCFPGGDLVEAFAKIVERRLVEARPHLAGIDEAIGPVEREQERAESATLALLGVQPMITNSWRWMHLTLSQALVRVPR